MENIFENAKFGDRFRTRGSVVYPIIFLSQKDDVYRFMDVNEYVLEYKAPNETPIGYPRRNDLEVVGKWEEPVDEEKLTKMANAYMLHPDRTIESYALLAEMMEAFKAGYRKAKEK